MASWAGLSCVLPSVVDPLKGHAQPIAGSAYTGTYWIFMHAGGGWDPTHLCDPKGNNGAGPDPMGRFEPAAIRQAVPEVTLEVAHGRLEEKNLEDVMLRYMAGEFQLLLTTTIVGTLGTSRRMYTKMNCYWMICQL